MIAQTPWLERNFSFDFPAGMYPVFLERLRGTAARIEELIGDIAGEKLSKRKNGKWSVKEHIGHLADLEALHRQRFHDFILGKETLTPADMQNKKTTAANHNSKKKKQLLSAFRHSRSEFIAQLERANDELIHRVAKHPRLNVPMRLVDMVYFICEHDDHHLARMRALLP
jgi:uncharacterized damage-inducible protein DinB